MEISNFGMIHGTKYTVTHQSNISKSQTIIGAADH